MESEEQKSIFETLAMIEQVLLTTEQSQRRLNDTLNTLKDKIDKDLTDFDRRLKIVEEYTLGHKMGLALAAGES